MKPEVFTGVLTVIILHMDSVPNHILHRGHTGAGYLSLVHHLQLHVLFERHVKTLFHLIWGKVDRTQLTDKYYRI